MIGANAFCVVPGELLEHVRQDRIGVVVRQQGVAIGRGPGDELGADAAGRAGLVLDVERLAHLLGELLGNLAGHHIDGAAGSVRNDDADGLGRIRRLGGGGLDEADGGHGGKRPWDKLHGGFLFDSDAFVRALAGLLALACAKGSLVRRAAGEARWCQCGWGSASSSAASTLRAAAVPMLT